MTGSVVMEISNDRRRSAEAEVQGGRGAPPEEGNKLQTADILYLVSCACSKSIYTVIYMSAVIV